MAQGVCPPWIGYLLINPLRKWLENPEKKLGPHVSPGMTVLEPGCGMGFFTLPLARMVGPSGKVIVVDIQPKMLEVVKKRAKKAGLADRVQCRLADGQGLGLQELAGQADFCAALHLVHEVPDQQLFFKDIYEALAPRGRLLVVEPRGHVSREAFQKSIQIAVSAGFRRSSTQSAWSGRSIILEKGDSTE